MAYAFAGSEVRSRIGFDVILAHRGWSPLGIGLHSDPRAAALPEKSVLAACPLHLMGHFCRDLEQQDPATQSD